MIDPELLAFVRQEIARGTPVREFSRILLNNGWTAEDIEHALSAVTGQHFNTTEPGGALRTYTFPNMTEFCLEAVHGLRVHIKRFGLLIFTGITVSSIVLLGMLMMAQWTPVVAALSTVATKVLLLLLSACIGMSVIATLLYPEESMSAHIKRVMKSLLPFLWSALLFYLVLSGGSILLIVPGILMLFSYSLWPVVVIGEQVSGSRAFVRSSVFIAEHRSKYILRFLWLIVVFGLIQASVFALIDNTIGFIPMLLVAFVLIITSVLYYAFLTVLYRSMKFAYTGTIVPTAGKRVMIIAVAYIPILASGVMVIFFFTFLKQLFERFV